MEIMRRLCGYVMRYDQRFTHGSAASAIMKSINKLREHGIEEISKIPFGLNIKHKEKKELQRLVVFSL